MQENILYTKLKNLDLDQDFGLVVLQGVVNRDRLEHTAAGTVDADRDLLNVANRFLARSAGTAWRPVQHATVG